MRLVIQRVSKAKVSTAERGVIGEIGKGLCVLIGITGIDCNYCNYCTTHSLTHSLSYSCTVTCHILLDGDDATDLDWCKKQIMTMKLWPDDNDKPWKRDLAKSDYQILLVSQFTLYAKVYKVPLHYCAN
jgi:D-Tyr-tRNAtyr deacylase